MQLRLNHHAIDETVLRNIRCASCMPARTYIHINVCTHAKSNTLAHLSCIMTSSVSLLFCRHSVTTCTHLCDVNVVCSCTTCTPDQGLACVVTRLQAGHRPAPEMWICKPYNALLCLGFFGGFGGLDSMPLFSTWPSRSPHPSGHYTRRSSRDICRKLHAGSPAVCRSWQASGVSRPA